METLDTLKEKLVRKIQIVPSTLEGEIDEYPIRDGQTALKVYEVILADLKKSGLYSDNLCYRMFNEKRLDHLLLNGTDRASNSPIYWEDDSILPQDKLFLDFEGTIHNTLARNLEKYRERDHHFAIAVYKKEGFKFEDHVRPLGFFKDKNPAKRTEYIVRVYQIEFSEGNK